MKIKELLTGTGVAIITPFKKNEDVDFDSLGKVIDFIINNGVNYIVTLGTTGETPVLSKKEKIDIINYTYDYVKDRVPVVVGMGSNDTRALLNDLNSFPLEKAVAILSASPYYNKPSQEGIYEHYKIIASKSSKPVILYNVPARTGRNITASTTLKLAQLENIVGIKEASGDMEQCMEILRDRPADFLVVSGDDALAFPQLACGMDGVISVAANCFPKDFTNMVQLTLNGNLRKAKQLNDSMINAYKLLFSENNPAGAKAFLTELKLIENVLRLPLVPLSEGIHKDVKAYLQNYIS